MPRVAFYAHDTYGLGHLSRCLKLARAFATRLTGIEGLILTGSPWHRLFAPPPGFRLVALPPVVKRGPGVYASRAGGRSLFEVLSERRRLIGDSVAAFQPDLMVVDNVPCGLHREVLPTLRRLKRQPGARAVLALRDVLDRPSAVAWEWQRAGAEEPLTELYDEIWVFGDRADVRRLAHGGPLAVAADKVLACGRLGRSGSAGSGAGPSGDGTRPLVLVTGGGGGDAPPLVRSYLEALHRFRPRVTSRVVLGPDFPPADAVRLPAAGLEVREFEPDLGTWLDRSDVVVSMAGYNTVCEILESGCRAVLVPRVRPRQEQWLRAMRWRREGRVRVIPPSELTPEALWLAIEETLAERAPIPRPLTGGSVAAARASRLLKSGGTT